MSDPAEAEFGARSRLRALWHWWWRFLAHHRPAAAGFLLLSAVFLFAALGPFLASHGAEEVGERFLPPSLEHPLGTDSQGYDLFARMVYGAWVTLAIAGASIALSLCLGTLAGALAGFAGGVVDLVLMRGVELAMSFPSFLLAMVTVAVLGFELRNLVLAVGLVGAPLFARQVRAEVIRVRGLEYVTAARALGLSPARVLCRHVLPNCLAPVVVLGTLGLGSAVLDVAGLNFLGLGGDPFHPPEWGLILKQGWTQRANLQIAVSGLAIFVTVLGCNLLGDGLRDELDPRTRRR
ncbi:MAG: ABC transporter permease [Planctomycetota bacterium]|nr:MAG: ABC transporter permease [Planctomycetota bacterium]